jgi:hypothetical protein
VAVPEIMEPHARHLFCAADKLAECLSAVEVGGRTRVVSRIGWG